MAEWDLTARMGPYLDRHLVFPLLEFLTVKAIYEETDLDRGKLDLLSDTNMVDFIMDVHKRLYPGKKRARACQKYGWCGATSLDPSVIFFGVFLGFRALSVSCGVPFFIPLKCLMSTKVF